VESPFDTQQRLVAIARFGKGELVVPGTSLWWNWIASEQESGADNGRLQQNLLSMPATAKQLPPDREPFSARKRL
jgi:hypothetical protein